MKTGSVSVENISVPFKIVIPMVLSIVSSTVWTTWQIWDAKASFQQAWTVHDARQWGKELKDANPGIRVPSADDVFWGARKPRRSTPQPDAQIGLAVRP